MINQMHKLYGVRTVLSLLLAPLTLIPVCLMLNSGSAGLAIIIQFLFYTYAFMFTWGLLSHTLLIRNNHTKLLHYLGAYFCCGIPVAFLLAEFTYDMRLVIVLSAGLLFFMVVPITAWFLYYKLMFKLEY